jgi:hypothetical protein
MITLQIGLERDFASLLEREANQLNLGVNEFVKQLLRQGLSHHREKPQPTIDSLFGLVQSTMDGQEYQRTMREE